MSPGGRLTRSGCRWPGLQRVGGAGVAAVAASGAAANAIYNFSQSERRPDTSLVNTPEKIEDKRQADDLKGVTVLEYALRGGDQAYTRQRSLEDQIAVNRAKQRAEGILGPSWQERETETSLAEERKAGLRAIGMRSAFGVGTGEVAQRAAQDAALAYQRQIVLARMSETPRQGETPQETTQKRIQDERELLQLDEKRLSLAVQRSQVELQTSCAVASGMREEMYAHQQMARDAQTRAAGAVGLVAGMTPAQVAQYNAAKAAGNNATLSQLNSPGGQIWRSEPTTEQEVLANRQAERAAEPARSGIVTDIQERDKRAEAKEDAEAEYQRLLLNPTPHPGEQWWEDQQKNTPEAKNKKAEEDFQTFGQKILADAEAAKADVDNAGRNIAEAGSTIASIAKGFAGEMNKLRSDLEMIRGNKVASNATHRAAVSSFVP